MTTVYQKVLQDVAVLIDALLVACGSSDVLTEARILVHSLLEEVKRGSASLSDILHALRRVRRLLEEARGELEESGCLDAYRVEDAIAALDSVIGPLDEEE